MTKAGLGLLVTRRRKWFAGLVVGALGSMILTVALAYWRSLSREKKPFPTPTLPTDVHQQLSGYSFTRLEGVRRIFTVHAARTVAFKEGGKKVLEDVFVEVFGRFGNRRDLLRTRRCNYDTQSGNLFSSGTVEIELNAQVEENSGASLRGKHPIYVETSRVFFRQQGSRVESDAPVRFRIGPASGSARGITYATTDGWMELKRSVVAELRAGGGAQPQPPVRLLASRLRYESSRGQTGKVNLWGPIEIIQGNRRVVAERGTIYLDAQNRITQAVLEDEVRVFESTDAGVLEGRAQRVRADFIPAAGLLRTLVSEGGVQIESKGRESFKQLEAQQIEMAFAGPHPQPQSGSASGGVRLNLKSTAETSSGSLKQAGAVSLPAATEETLTAAQLEVTFRPGGQSLEKAQTIGPGTLVLIPRDPAVGERVVSAGFMSMGFDTRSRLEILRGFSGTQIVFQPSKQAPPGSVPQVTSAEKLEATFDSTTQALRSIKQFGDFSFREGDRHAGAEQASYAAEMEVLTLTGQPRIWDLNTRSRAKTILLNLRTDTAEGVSKVQSTHVESASPGDASRHDPPPTALDDPTNVLADRMLAQRGSQLVHYEGHVRAWRGQDVMESQSLDFYGNERRVHSGSRVLTSYLQPSALLPAAPESPAKREMRPVTIKADRFDYPEQEHKASYRGSVQLQTEDTRLEADRMDVFFLTAPASGASEVERAVADGHVQVIQPTRRANGQHAEYYAAPGKILLTGGPPTLYDVEKGFTTGQRLTFFIHDDTFFVDGGDGSSSLSKRRISQ